MSIITGYLPPNDPDIETAVIGACLIDVDARRETLAVIGKATDVFYDQVNALVYEVIFDLANRRRDVDILTVTAELRSRGKLDEVGGPGNVAMMSNSISDASNLPSHLRYLLDLYMRRQGMTRSAEDYHKYGSNLGDGVELVTDSLKYYTSLLHLQPSGRSVDIKTLAMGEADAIGTRMQQRQEGVEVFSGHKTLLSAWDGDIGGLKPGNNIVIAARPGMGKTALALTIAKNLCHQSVPVGFLSAEMSAKELVSRLIAMDTGIPVRNQASGMVSELEYEKIVKAATVIAGYPLYIVDTGLQGVHNFRSKVAQLVADHGIQVNIGDYIQLMTDYGTGFMNREQKVSEMSAAGKIAAKEHDLTNIWLSQLSRQVENRGGSKRPLLSDLRESGAIEQDADVVTFIYRAEYYNEMTDEDGKSTRGVAELINAKNRNGDICKSVVAFQDYSVRFMDMSEYNTINGRASRPAIDTWSQE